MEKLFCQKCKSEQEYDETTRIFSNKTRHVEAKCRTCKTHIKFLSQDDDRTAADFEMPFGKYKGDTLGDIVEKDKQYLIWLYQQDIQPKLHMKIEEVLNNTGI